MLSKHLLQLGGMSPAAHDAPVPTRDLPSRPSCTLLCWGCPPCLPSMSPRANPASVTGGMLHGLSGVGRGSAEGMMGHVNRFRFCSRSALPEQPSVMAIFAPTRGFRVSVARSVEGQQACIGVTEQSVRCTDGLLHDEGGALFQEPLVTAPYPFLLSLYEEDE